MRELFTLDPSVAHLNHGSFGVVPRRVQLAQQRIRDEIETNAMRFYARELPERVASARAELAEFIGADPAGSALVANATSGTAVALQSMRLGAGDEVVVTDHIYNSVAVALERLRREAGIEITVVSIGLDDTDDDMVAKVSGAVRAGRTRLIVLDHVASATAKLFPIARIADAVRGSGAAIHVDGAHAPGMLTLPAADLGVDFWVGNFHKWAYAPRGTALLHVAEAWRDRVAPVVVARGDLRGFPISVELQGTRDMTCWLAAPEGTRMLTELGQQSRAANVALAAAGQRVIADALGLTHVPDPGPEVSMRVIPLPDGIASTDEGADALRNRIALELDTEVTVVAWNGTGFLRVCANIYNTLDEYEKLAHRLRSVLS
jgi:isopenicillin-N epimerase